MDGLSTNPQRLTMPELPVPGRQSVLLTNSGGSPSIPIIPTVPTVGVDIHLSPRSPQIERNFTNFASDTYSASPPRRPISSLDRSLTDSQHTPTPRPPSSMERSISETQRPIMERSFTDTQQQTPPPRPSTPIRPERALNRSKTIENPALRLEIQSREFTKRTLSGDQILTRKGTQQACDDDPDLLEYLATKELKTDVPTGPLEAVLFAFVKSVPLKSTSSFMSKARDCFAGSAGVDWLINNYSEFTNRAEACDVLSMWCKTGRFEPIITKTFEDSDDALFKFKGATLKIFLTRRRDFKTAQYQELDGKEKLEDLMFSVMSSSKQKKFPNKKPVDIMSSIDGTKLCFHASDDMPLGNRKKMIHSTGVVAACQFEVTANPHRYTGIFKSGCTNCIIRFSSTTEQLTSQGPGCLSPAIAIKFLRNKVHSANALAMYSLDGQDSFNFFEHDLSNHVPEFASSVWKNATAVAQKGMHYKQSKFPAMLGLSDIAAFDEDGNPSLDINFPFRLVFHPTPALHFSVMDDWRYEDQPFKLLAQGTPVYDVYAQDQPLQEFDTSSPLPNSFKGVDPLSPPGSTSKNLFKIGTITLTSAATSSQFGDKNLFFQHVSFEDDIKLKPEWYPFAVGDMIVQKEYIQTIPTGFAFQDLSWKCPVTSSLSRSDSKK